MFPAEPCTALTPRRTAQDIWDERNERIRSIKRCKRAAVTLLIATGLGSALISPAFLGLVVVSYLVANKAARDARRISVLEDQLRFEHSRIGRQVLAKVLDKGGGR